MDRAEAAKILEIQLDVSSVNTPSCIELHEALDLAIEALKGDLHCPKCGTIVRDGRQYHDLVYRGEAEPIKGDAESATTTDCNDCIWNTCNYNKIDWDLEVSEDCISRADTIKAICAECTQEGYDECRADCTEVAIVKGMPTVKLKKPCDSLLTAESDECKEQKSKLDCISRQQAIEAFCDDCRGLKPGQCEHWDKCKSQKVLRSLPPVIPTEQTIKEIMDFIGGMNMTGEISNEAYAKISDFVDDGTPTERTGEWIPVSERLPEGYAQYLCYCEGGDCYVFWLDNEPWAEETVEKERILAWMPLPDPYKGGDTE